MANQITIDIGAAANDGTGDPLRTAFNYVNNNFSNVWNTGLPNSNIQFSDNRILTVNTNANLVLAPNGIGKVASNVDIVPNTANVLSLGGSTRRWNTIYGQYLDLSHNATIGGNLTVTGNLSAGNISYTSNVFVGDLEGSVFDGASSIVLDVIDSAIYVDNYYYANGVPVTFGGNYGNSNVAAYLPTYSGNITANNVIATRFIAVQTVAANDINAGNVSANNVFVVQSITAHDAYANAGTFSGDPITGDASLYIGSPSFTDLGTDVMAQFTGNVTNYGQINFQNYSNSPTASGDYIATADNGNDTAHFIDMGITSSTWDGTQTNVLTGLNPNNGYLYVQDGNLTLGTRAGNVSYSWKFDTTGNLTVAGNIIPTGNNTQSLGNATRQWNDLWLSNATIYMNSVPISLTAGNILTVDGADVVTTAANGESSIGNLNILGATIEITAGAPETLINISPDVEGWAYLQLPNDATANVYNTRLHNDVGNIEIGANGNTWQFNNAGSLMLPGNAEANNASISSIENGAIVKLNSQANGYVGMTGFGSAGNNVAAITAVGLDGETDRVIISVYNPNIDDGEAWTFNNAGDFTTAGGNIFFGTQVDDAVIVPSGIGVKIAADRSDTTTSYVNITSSGITIDARSGSTADITIRAGDDVSLEGGNKTSAPGQRGGDIFITPGAGGPDNNINAGDGGYVEINGGEGGLAEIGTAGTGGEVRLNGGPGGTANITNAQPAGAGGTIVVLGGSAGDNVGNLSLSGTGGNVDIYGGSGSFDIANSVPSGAPGNVNLYGGNWGFITPSGNIYLNTYDGSNFKTLSYDHHGNVTMALGGALNMVGSSSGIVQSPNNDLIVTVQDDENDDWALYNRVTDTGTTLGETRLRRGDFQINFPNASKNFNFDDSGVLGLPGDIALNTQGGDISLYAIDDGDSGSAEIKTISYAGGTLGSNVRVTQSAATISTSNATYTWTFDNTGNLTVPGNTIVSTANATGGLGGKSISITAGASDTVTWNSNPGGNVNITGGYGSFGDGGGGPGGQVNIVGGGSNDSHAGNVTINSGSSTWTFDYTNKLSSGPLSITSQFGLGTTGTILENGGTLELIGNGTGAGTTGCVVVGWNSSYGTAGNVAQMYFNPADSTGNIVVTTGNTAATSYQWNFDKTGNLTIPGNISGNTAGYAIGYRDIPQVTFSANATAALADAGKHFYSTTAGNLALTLPDNSNVAYPTGATLTVVVNAAGNVLVNQGTGVTLYMAGSSTTGNRVVGAYGLASVMKVAANTWVISGTGVY